MEVINNFIELVTTDLCGKKNYEYVNLHFVARIKQHPTRKGHTVLDTMDDERHTTENTIEEVLNAISTSK